MDSAYCHPRNKEIGILAGFMEKILAGVHSLLSGYRALQPPCDVVVEVRGPTLCSLWRKDVQPVSSPSDLLECPATSGAQIMENKNKIKSCYHKYGRDAHLERENTAEALLWYRTYPDCCSNWNWVYCEQWSIICDMPKATESLLDGLV